MDLLRGSLSLEISLHSFASEKGHYLILFKNMGEFNLYSQLLPTLDKKHAEYLRLV